MLAYLPTSLQSKNDEWKTYMHMYLNREFECALSGEGIHVDPTLLALQQLILPCITETVWYQTQKRTEEAADRAYYDERNRQRERRPYIHLETDDNVLNSLFWNMTTLRRQLVEPFEKALLEWKASRCSYLERHAVSRDAVCLEYAFCRFPNSTEFRTTLQNYLRLRKRFEKTGEVYLNVEHLQHLEKTSLPWGFPSIALPFFHCTRPIDFEKMNQTA